MRRQHVWTWACGLAVLGWAAAAAAADEAKPFEGTVRQISLSMPTEGLKPAVDELGPEQVFAISDEKLAEVAGAAGSGARIVKTEIKVDGSKFRVDMVINGKPGFMLVDSAVDTTALVVPEDKVYLQVTGADRAAAAEKQASESRAQDMLREQAKQLPPEDRARLEAALGAKTEPTAAPAAGTPQSLDRQGIVNGARSTLYELREGETVSRAWVTQEHPQLLAAFRAAAKSQQTVRSAPPTPMERFAEVGLPMRVQTYAGERYDQIDLVEITSGPVADTDMQVPEGFTKVDPNATPAATAGAATPPGTPAPTP